MYLEGSDQHRGWFHSSLLEFLEIEAEHHLNRFYLMDLL